MLAATFALPPAAHAQQTHTVTVYSSLAAAGADAPLAGAVERGALLALQDQGFTAGAVRVRYVALRDSSSAGLVSPHRVATNAFTAVGDPSAVALIGNLSSAETATSAPILNRGGLLQVSPTNTATGLTRSGAGAGAGEPGRYRPTGRRHYVRLVPSDRMQGAALAALMRRRGCRRIAVVNDGEATARGVAAQLARGARAKGLRVVSNALAPRRPRVLRRLVESLARRKPRCLAYSGSTSDRAAELFRKIAARMRGTALFGSDELAQAAFARALGRSVAWRVTITFPLTGAYPPAGRAVLRRLSQIAGGAIAVAHAVYGYEAMRLVLDGIATGGPDRANVREAVLRTKRRRGVIGSYGFDRHGDTTASRFGVLKIVKRRLTFRGTVEGR